MFVPVKESRKNATSGTVFLQFNYFRQKYLAVMAATADEGRQVPLTKSCKMQKNYTGQRVQKGAKGCKRVQKTEHSIKYFIFYRNGCNGR